MRPAIYLLLSLALLIAGFAALPRLAEWAQQWTTIGVYLVYFLLMSTAGRLF